MSNETVDVITTTISGSIKDWIKVRHILPLFRIHGFENAFLHVASSHREARIKARTCLDRGGRVIISAGGSGTFNSVLEGCCDSGIGLDKIRLGFLRKGSADLIAKTLGMSEDMESAIQVLSESVAYNRTVKCDIIRVETESVLEPTRHFAGFAGAEIFGDIPTVTENRFIKLYKGLLAQCLGDLGPFFVGASISIIKKVIGSCFIPKAKWRIYIDGEKAASGLFHALIIVNGDLGKDLSFARSVPLGSGDFYLFAIRDKGLFKLPFQFRKSFDASIMRAPEKWGFETYRIRRQLSLVPENRSGFNVNVDGAAMRCTNSATFSIGNPVNLYINRSAVRKEA